MASAAAPPAASAALASEAPNGIVLAPVGVGPAGLNFAWRPDVDAAARYAAGRRGVVAFAVVDEQGRLTGRRVRRPFRSASVIKAMLLVSYLDHPSVRDRGLARPDRALLTPMVTVSDNATASRVYTRVGATALRRLARRAGMRRFQPHPRWGDSLITAEDQARFFSRIDRLVPARHRAFARRLLAEVVSWQRWGIPSATPRGWRVLFKGGWRPSPTGQMVHQAALVERGERRVAVAVLTDANPAHGHGTETVRGVAARLLAGLR